VTRVTRGGLCNSFESSVWEENGGAQNCRKGPSVSSARVSISSEMVWRAGGGVEAETGGIRQLVFVILMR
jgi:hypothetical protein